MTCYARPLAFFLLVVAAAMAVFSQLPLLADIIAVIAASLTGTVLAIRIIARTRRSRAASGACTTCRHPCQGRPVVIIDELSIRQPSWPDAGQLRSRDGSRS